MVREFGTSFARRWLYYSDWLMGYEACRAMALTGGAIAIAVGAAVCLLALALTFRAAILRMPLHLPRAQAFALGPAAAFVAIGSWYLKHLQLKHSRVAAPVVAFVASFLREMHR
jgi:hypothetical protein